MPEPFLLRLELFLGSLAPASRQQSHVYNVGRGKGQEHEVRGEQGMRQRRFGGYETREQHGVTAFGDWVSLQKRSGLHRLATLRYFPSADCFSIPGLLGKKNAGTPINLGIKAMLKGAHFCCLTQSIDSTGFLHDFRAANIS